MTSVSKMALVVTCALTSSCTGSTDGFTSEEQEANRADFALFAVGDFYVGNGSIIERCAPSLSPTEAYPGIDIAAEWVSFALWRVDVVTHSAASAPIGERLVLTHTNQEVGFATAPAFWSLMPYDGATPPGLDAGLTCGTLIVNTENVLLARHHLSAAGVSESRYGMSTDDVVAEVALAQESATPARGTQESFLAPYRVADEIVGSVDWPPPALTDGGEPDAL